MNPRRILIDQLSDGFEVTASCRGDNDFQEIALVSSELDIWHLRHPYFLRDIL